MFGIDQFTSFATFTMKNFNQRPFFFKLKEKWRSFNVAVRASNACNCKGSDSHTWPGTQNSELDIFSFRFVANIIWGIGRKDVIGLLKRNIKTTVEKFARFWLSSHVLRTFFIINYTQNCTCNFSSVYTYSTVNYRYMTFGPKEIDYYHNSTQFSKLAKNIYTHTLNFNIVQRNLPCN